MPESWVEADEWKQMLAGKDCPFCAALKNMPDDDEHGYTVATMERSVLRLQRNQSIKGYCVLIALRHVTEPFQMHQGERNLFFEDMMQAAQAIQQVFNPDKMNYEILGNALPHLHAHLKPRYLGDPAPHGRISSKSAEPVLLSDAEYRQIVGDLREAMGLIREPVNEPNLNHLLDKQGRVTRWPNIKKPQEQIAVLHYMASKFETGREYTEREVNEVLKQWHLFNDWATLRRELCDRGYLGRARNGTAYWLENMLAEQGS